MKIVGVPEERTVPHEDPVQAPAETEVTPVPEPARGGEPASV
jgi:hypothetical protein